MKDQGWTRGYSLAVSIGLLVGCGGSAEPDVQPVLAAIGIECGSAAPTEQACHGLNFASAFTYNTASCFKAVVLDVRGYDGNLGSSSAALETRVRWGSSPPVPEDCSSAVVLSDLFESVGGQYTYLGHKSAYGQVVAGACVVPSLSWGSEMVRGHDYRVAAGARRSNASSAPTRVVVVETLANGANDQCLSSQVNDRESCTTDSCDPGTGTVTHAAAADGSNCGPSSASSAGVGGGPSQGTCASGICSVKTSGSFGAASGSGGASATCF